MLDDERGMDRIQVNKEQDVEVEVEDCKEQFQPKYPALLRIRKNFW